MPADGHLLHDTRWAHPHLPALVPRLREVPHRVEADVTLVAEQLLLVPVRDSDA